ncbi:YitT family protein [Paenibacillus mesophilus]|uniref:YitT family protein n=1 Tax=Paenibacillus mesophilus TaxID=2582849 RepID=UPI00110EC13A|nr:YitT family protein [Paenibacillus mesophilus]TMV47184.1 YitT family protein [Paenibacillus mesophilus]
MRRKHPAIRIGSPLHQVIEYGLLLAGCLTIALSFNFFLNPNQIASGGVAGISTIIQQLFGIEPAVMQWVLNIPLFILGMLFLGGQFGLKTAVASVVLPLFVLLTRDLGPLTTNALLATIYGGIGIGAGLGIVFRGRGSTGGLDSAAQLIHKWTGLGYGLAVALLDGAVILAAGVVFSPEKALYALIGLFVTTKTIDIVQIGFRYSKVAFIMTKEMEPIRDAILFELDRGLTLLDGRGGYTGEDRPTLMVVVSQTEVTRLKTIVRSVDPNAFVILTDANEVLGEGFKLHG